jgi:excisionase family DNA binding protein
VTPAPVPLADPVRDDDGDRPAALNHAQRRALDHVDPERREVLLALVDRVLGDHASQPTLDVPEVAKVLGVSRASAYELVRTGVVPSIRVGRRVVVPLPGLVALLLEGGGGP